MASTAWRALRIEPWSWVCSWRTSSRCCGLCSCNATYGFASWRYRLKSDPTTERYKLRRERSKRGPVVKLCACISARRWCLHPSGIDVTVRSVVWSSSNATIASVSDAGLVTPGTSTGTVTITARSKADTSVKGVSVITVNPATSPWNARRARSRELQDVGHARSIVVVF